MSPVSRRTQSGFTLLELVVVLGIIALMTGVALRALDGVDDQQRYEANQQLLEDIRAAVLGSPDDRALDGSRTLHGFVADLNRLPRTVATPGGDLTLAELWVNPAQPYAVRQAVAANGVPPGHEDPEVVVAGGWRGPYLRLPITSDILRDGWGNPMHSPNSASPPEPESTGYARLRDAADQPITSVNQDIRIVRTLGANGAFDTAPLESEYDADTAIAFSDDQFRATLTVQVEVLDDEFPATVDVADQITLRIFAPSPANPAQIAVVAETVAFNTNPVVCVIPSTAQLTSGPRIVRAYFEDTNPNGTTSFRKSAVRQMILRPGANFAQLTIDR